MRFLKGLLIVFAQLLGLVVISYLAYLSLYRGRVFYNVCSWAILPLLGMISAYMVTVHGVNNYLAWIAPPTAGLAAHYLSFFYMPDSAGPSLVCAFASIVGAAAGDVSKKLKRK